MIGLRPQRNFPVLLLQSRKMKGYTLQQNRCTSSSRSHSLSSSIIQYPHLVQYSTHIQYNLQWILFKPYKVLNTCNTMGQYHGLQQNHVPKPCARPNHLGLNLKSRLTHAILWDNTMGYNKPCAQNHALDLTTFDSIPSQG